MLLFTIWDYMTNQSTQCFF